MIKEFFIWFRSEFLSKQYGTAIITNNSAENVLPVTEKGATI